MKLSAYKRILSLASLIAFMGVVTLPTSRAEAEPMREFILSCAYGTLAGTLVGVASLAFSDKPGDNLNRVARGASIGLYGGILLGAYIVNNVPTENDDDLPAGVTSVPTPVLQIYPLVSERGIEGGAASLSLLRF